MARVAIVTGGGSGIGEALCRALAAQGDTVVIADIDGAAAQRVAGDIGARASAAKVDVRDATAVQALVDDTVSAHGRLDLIVNNAGIGVGGETYELSRSHWDRIIDVNVRGVVHGVRAVYPQMVARRSGTIVNVASLAGLVPAPLLTPYAMTKHAVVGLSVSLRAEAAGHGVDVSVVCPAAVDTPLLDATSGGLPETPSSTALDLRRFLTKDLGPAITADALGAAVIRGVERNRGIIVEPARARAAWVVMRALPGLGLRLQQRAARAERVAGGFG